MLASINGIDLEPALQYSTYKMQTTDVYDKWTDANHKNHRHIYGQRISGSFDMVFTSAKEHADFLSLVNGVKDSEGKIKITVYVQDLGIAKEIEAFYTFIAGQYVDMKNGYIKDRITVQIEEAGIE